MKFKHPSREISEDKAKKFLKDVMGGDTFNKFIREGKIEINSGKYIYELTAHGTLTNKPRINHIA